MLSRQLPRRTIASAVALSNPYATARPFSTTLLALNSNRPANPNQRQQKQQQQQQQQQPQTRRNPLIGEIQRAPNPPVSTEKPRATMTPSPSRAPASSAEVPPNADLPPPSTMTATGAQGSSIASRNATATTPGQQQHRYDARSDVINLADLIGKSAERYVDSIEDPTTQHKVHTRPITGRTVFLEHAGRNSAAARQGLAASGVQHAFRVLDRTVKDQKIKTLHYQQRFHERPGMKRKRLKMVRWRARFKKGFKATASRVLELKKQGW